MTFSFRHTDGFGRSMEYYLIGQMLMEGLDCYVPLVDDHGVDCVVKKEDGTFIEIQIKARSSEVKMGDGALFASIFHESRPNYYFVFVSERLGKTWIVSSEEFLAETKPIPSGKNKGKRNIKFNGCKTNKVTGKKEEYMLVKHAKYECTDFARFYRSVSRPLTMRIVSHSLTIRLSEQF